MIFRARAPSEYWDPAARPIPNESDVTMPIFDAEFWDTRYGESTKVWSGKPNPQLVSEVSGLKPRTALDIGSGEGADSIWLARHGWHVTAVDFSQVALDRAAEHAAT